MCQYIIDGSFPIKGKIRARGNKNAALPCISAALLTDEPVILKNVPDIEDVSVIVDIMTELGREIKKTGKGTLKIKALSEVCKLIGRAVHLDTTLGRVLQVLHDILHMERATLVLLDTGGQRLSIKASYGLSIEEEQRGIYGLSEGVCGQIFQSGSPCVVPDIHSEPLFLNRTGARSNIKKEGLAFIGVPIKVDERPVGVLTVDRLFGPEVSFEEDISFLGIVSTLIGQFLVLHHAINQKEEKLVEENKSLKAELHSRFNRHYIIGSSRPMRSEEHTSELQSH